MSHKNTDEIITRVKEILAISAETDQDKALQQFVRFIFTDEFKKDSIIVPVKKREKDSYKFLEQYIKLVHSLFKLKKDERNKLYNNASFGKGYNDISQHEDKLDKLVAKKKDDLSKINEDKMNQLNVIKSYLYNLISHQPTTVFSKLDKFHFYFILYVPSPSSLKFLLYSILKNKFRDVLAKFDYQDFCPNFDDETCLNLIILFFDNIKNEKREFLFIFALLIFQYEVIFKYRINKKIPKYILQHAAGKTYQIVESKTFKNGLIFEYTYTEYLSNLDKVIFLLEERKKSNSSINNKYESQINKNQINNLNNNDNPQSQKNQKENSASSIPESELKKAEKKNSEHNKFEEEKKNELKGEENTINSTEVNKINIPFSSIDKNDKNENNIPNGEGAGANKIYKEAKDVAKEGINEGGKVKMKIEEKDNKLETNNLNDKKELDSGIKGENLPEINNSNVIASKKEENNITNQPKEEINNLNNQELYSLIQQQLSTQENENKRRFSELEKKVSEQKDEILKQKDEISKLQSEIECLKGTISTIQIRKLAKNFLNIFKSNLSQEEIEIIKQDNTKRAEETIKSLRRKYPLSTETENFKIVCEIVNKSGETLNKGNCFAHSLNLKDYEVEIMEYKEKHNIKLANDETLEKIFFLKKIKVSDDSFDKCFLFVLKYCGKEMTLGFLRKEDNISTFIEGKKK